jgi:hypothetical protein
MVNQSVKKPKKTYNKLTFNTLIFFNKVKKQEELSLCIKIMKGRDLFVKKNFVEKGLFLSF